MQLDGVKAGVAGAPGSCAMFGDDRPHLGGAERLGQVIGLHAAAVGKHLALRLQGRRRHAAASRTLDMHAANAPAMHDLQGDQATTRVHRCANRLPGLHMRLMGDARLAAIGLPLGAGPGAFGYHQAGFAPLAVVLDHQVIGAAVGIGAVARHGRHDDAVLQMQCA